MTGTSKDAVAQPRMLVLARESRSLTQGQLAAAMSALDGPGSKISQAYISRAEAGRLAVSGERLKVHARTLEYPVELLCVTAQEFGAGAGLVHHRKKQAASAGDLKRIHAVLNLTRIQLHALLRDVPRPAGKGIPKIAVDALTTPADAARRLRAEWTSSGGPLDSVVELAEETGALVAYRKLVAPVPLDSGTESVPVDAVSCSPSGEDPLVLLNVGTPAERQRFTLAHELGHMVMHEVPHPEQEKQANSFAAELLMPARDIRAELARGQVTMSRLLALKARWKVSMWALLRRAHTLGILSDWQYRGLAVEMSSLGYRTSEPGTLESEIPTAVASMLTWHFEQGRDVAELAGRALLSPREFTDLYLRCPAPSTGTASRSLSSAVGEVTR
ncbi:ImmA/IrrE family metallo-endopeptidase [Amycolatopsis sp. cg5]|uniref:ImmA/IrrE family metallo-endopeptidase n=1 Tax=Amycolatopsis sp. cg5 TaxID=3238802 RepID=UPI0035259B6A